MTQDEVLQTLRKVIAESDNFTTWTVSTPHLVELAQAIVAYCYVQKGTSSPQRPWVGLTDEDCDEVERWVEFKEEGSDRIQTSKLIRYIEAKLKEKNNV